MSSIDNFLTVVGAVRSFGHVVQVLGGDLISINDLIDECAAGRFFGNSRETVAATMQEGAVAAIMQEVSLDMM